MDRAGTPRTLGALATHDFIDFEASLDDLPQTRWLRQATPAPRYVVRANTTVAHVLACAEGHGIALLPAFVALREPRLQRLLPRSLGPSREMWGVTHADMRGNARAAAVLDWLAELAAG